jgi:hypothetical protein
MRDFKDKPEDLKWKARGYIIIAPEEVHEKVIAWLDQLPDSRLIFHKTSHRQRLVLVEEPY